MVPLPRPGQRVSKKTVSSIEGDGSSLCATRDIAYHMWKWTQCDDLVNVLGEDPKLQAKQVGMTLSELGEKVPMLCSMLSSNSRKARWALKGT